MTVSTIASLATGIGRSLGNQNAKAASSVKQLLGGSVSVGSGNDVASIATATALQAHVTSLRTTTQNIAQASSMAQVAQGGASQIERALSRMQELSERASDGTLSDDERAALDVEFQSVRQEIGRIAAQTRFSGQPLLDGSLTSARLGIAEDGEADFSVGDLSEEGLFAGAPLSIKTAGQAAQAGDVVAQAQVAVIGAQATLGALQEGVEFAFASLEVAANNQEAAASFLTEEDFAVAATQKKQGEWQADAITTLLSQTNKLPQNILQLLSE